MNLDDNMIADIAQQLGLSGNPGISPGELRRMEGDLLVSLMDESLMSMMDNKQRARLQKVIELIEH